MEIIQVGGSDWSSQTMPENLFVAHLNPSEIRAYVDKEKSYRKAYKEQQELIAKLKEEEESEEIPEEDLLEPPKKIAGLIITNTNYPDADALVEIAEFFEPYEIFYDQEAVFESKLILNMLRKKMAQACDFSDPDRFLKRLSRSLFVGQYGAKMHVSSLQVAPDFRGQVSLDGISFMVLEGDFGSDYKQVAHFRYNLPYNKQKGLNLFFEHLCSKGVEAKIVVQLFHMSSLAGISQEWEFEMSDPKKQLYIESEVDGFLAVSMFAKGEGSLKLGPCHYRDSRDGLGEFILGGQRFVDDGQQEFMYYFDPQDFKPPFCVYFSGFRSAEGFEGFWMMKNMRVPFMLICDPRLEGGSFYLGSPELEQKISDVIQEKLDFLGFDNSQLVLSGLSMGTFGATYHGSKLAPHAIILGKPVLSLGEVALKEKIIRPGGFPTSLDILSRYTRKLDRDGAEELDYYFWKQFKKGDFSNTKFIIAYMKDDDYDSTAFQKILDYTRDTTATIIGKGWAGRHGDGGSGPVLWFLRQYYNVLKNDFGRKY